MKYFILIMSLLFSNGSGFCQDMPDESHISYRLPTAAGTFYPEKPDSLRQMINTLLDDTQPGLDNENEIIAMVVPHAGYVFSGGVAAKAYNLLKGRHYDAIVIIGPSHFKLFEGASIFDGDAYTTPLGIAKVDKELAKQISDNKLIKISRIGHTWNDNRNEHSVEVQIPFLQVVQPDVPIVPIIVGEQDNRIVDALMKALAKAIGDSKKKVLLIASSDLSHYHQKDTALALDSSIIEAFERFDYFLLESQLFSHKWEACGAGPITTVMMTGERFGANETELLEYSTSADSKYINAHSDKVVGYMSAVVSKTNRSLKMLPELNENDKRRLLSEARQAIENITLKNNLDNIIKDVPKELESNYAAFVTIRKGENLRACMGHTHATSPLIDEVIESAKIAATKDFRFGAIRPEELKDLNIEITILSRMKRILNKDEIEVGRDGLYIRYNGNAGLLLPQVATERNWDRETFLKALCDKAGLDENTYENPDAEIFIFHAIIIK